MIGFGNLAANGIHTITRINANTFSLDGVDGTLSGVYTGGGQWSKQIANLADPAARVSFTQVTPSRYTLDLKRVTD